MTDASRDQDPLAEELDSLEAIEEELAAPASELTGGVWWWVLVRGILAIAFGVIALLSPASAFLAVVLVFGAYAIVDGIVEIVHGIAMRGGSKSWGWLIFAGVVSILAGIAALVLPIVAGLLGAILMLWMIVAYNLVHGVMVIGVAVKSERGRAWGIVAGVLSVLFSVVLAILILVTPGTAVLGLIFAVGIYAVVFGITLAAAAIATRVRGGAKAVVGADAVD